MPDLTVEIPLLHQVVMLLLIVFLFTTAGCILASQAKASAERSSIACLRELEWRLYRFPRGPRLILVGAEKHFVAGPIHVAVERPDLRIVESVPVLYHSKGADDANAGFYIGKVCFREPKRADRTMRAARIKDKCGNRVVFGVVELKLNIFVSARLPNT